MIFFLFRTVNNVGEKLTGYGYFFSSKKVEQRLNTGDTFEFVPGRLLFRPARILRIRVKNNFNQ